MIRCNLWKLMGERKLNVTELAREIELPRSTIDGFFKDEAQRVDLQAVDKLCEYFGCEISDLFERVK
ncbi:MAG: helix-turn-helix transcriptional regulator [Candidatus Thiodiazotropha sp. (ex Lucinoma borealis)]|nr:helix-turn-helix transcriptional regulator [Candidatus Thiodiazotropha sp. (ex Lucinoma borealis)]